MKRAQQSDRKKKLQNSTPTEQYMQRGSTAAAFTYIGIPRDMYTVVANY